MIGATNEPKAIDSALLRPGRLEITIQIPLPDDLARVGILKQHLADHCIEGDLNDFVSFSRGWSGADIMKAARDVRRLARRKGRFGHVYWPRCRVDVLFPYAVTLTLKGSAFPVPGGLIGDGPP